MFVAKKKRTRQEDKGGDMPPGEGRKEMKKLATQWESKEILLLQLQSAVTIHGNCLCS
jgi:hypothetical protein